MPIYQFRCPDCGYEDELLLSVDAPNPACPQHKNSKLYIVMEKLFPTGTTFKLMGGGWFRDGYSNAKKETKTGNSKG